MATPVADTYVAPTGVDVYIGRFAPSISALSGNAVLGDMTVSGDLAQAPTPATAITVNDYPDQSGFQRVGGSRAITVSGTYGGSPSGIQARAVPHGTALGSTAYPWTTIDPAPAGGTFSAPLVVAQGGWYAIQVRDTAAAVSAGGSNKWGVGIFVALLGQSNIQNMFNQVAVYPTGDPRSIAYISGGWNRIGNVSDGYPPGTPASTYGATYTTGLSSIHGDPLVYLANRLAAAGNCPVFMLPYAVGGSTIDTWLPGSGGNWATFAAAAGAAGSDMEAAIWLQGESDAGTSMATYKTRLAAVHAGLLALSGRTSATFSLAVVPIGSCTSAWRAEGLFGPVRQAHGEYVAGASGAAIVNSMIDGTLVDSVHNSIPSYNRQARRWAEWILRAAGGVLGTMQGPSITSATRAGSTITVNIAQHGGTSLVDGAGGGGSALGGFRVFDGASPVTISSTAIVGNTVTLNLSTVPAGVVTLDFGMANFALGTGTPAAAAILYDNQAVPGDTVGLPLQPCPTMTVT